MDWTVIFRERPSEKLLELTSFQKCIPMSVATPEHPPGIAGANQQGLRPTGQPAACGRVVHQEFHVCTSANDAVCRRPEAHEQKLQNSGDTFLGIYLRRRANFRGRPRSFGPPSIACNAFIPWSRVAPGRFSFRYFHMRGIRSRAVLFILNFAISLDRFANALELGSRCN